MIAIMAAAVLVAHGSSPQDVPRVWEGDEVTFTARPRPDFPMSARANRGEAGLICTVTARGTFRHCRIEDETPRGSGFGRAAANSMLQGAQIAMPEDGPSEGDQVRAKITFWNGQ
ncbi:hypothetical protein [Brevundimonas sp.]|uniref:hypothetical protein n=1 Tax=Brevundimonas sp. TaxID=1871086 RepID=UPI003BACDBC9